MERCKDQMIDYKLSPEVLVMVQGSSKGTQPKYYDNSYWYKANVLGYEGLSERLVSVVLKHSNVSKFVEYEECTINGRSGCCSKSFLKDGESFLSFQRLYELYTGDNLQSAVLMFPRTEERLDFVRSFVYENTGMDCSVYLSKILTLDMLTLNTDRHFNNLGLVVNVDKGTYATAPIFDNGNSLLSDWGRFSEEELEDNIHLAYSQPFSSNFYKQAKCAGINLAIDYEALSRDLEKERSSRALQVLQYQLVQYREIIPDLRHIRERDEEWDR